MKSTARYIIIFLSLLVFGCSDNSDKLNRTEVISSKLVNSAGNLSASASAIESLQTEAIAYYQYPALTIILNPAGDVQKSIRELVKGGGVLVYDPNNGEGSDIGFYIAELTPDQINDSKYLKRLNLKAGMVSRNIKGHQTPNNSRLDFPDDSANYIPVKNVGLFDLVSQDEQAILGEGTVTAVIDTGIDASHPAFNSRVDYVYDATEETKTKLLKIRMLEGETVAEPALDLEKTDLPQDIKNAKIVLPKEAKGSDALYIGLIDEAKFFAQLSEADKVAKSYLDVNYNGEEDRYLVLAIERDGVFKAYVDTDSDLNFTDEVGVIEYNKTTQETRDEGMVNFRSRTNINKYPLLVTCLLYTSPSPRDATLSRMPSSA